VALADAFYLHHMKRQSADAIATAVPYHEALGWPDVAEALRKGYADALRKAVDVILAGHGGEPGAAWEAANDSAMAGDRARALDMLERAYSDGEPNIPYIGCLPVFDPLRAEARFQVLLRNMGLPQ
jgi:hypothetical protein